MTDEEKMWTVILICTGINLFTLGVAIGRFIS